MRKEMYLHTPKQYTHREVSAVHLRMNTAMMTRGKRYRVP